METIEYAIVAGLVMTGIVAIVASLAAWLEGEYTAFQGTLGA